MVFKFDDCGKLVEFTLKSTKFSKSAFNYGASNIWSIFRNSSKNIVEIAFLFRGTVTQKRTGCFEKGGYRANKLLFWIFPLGGVGDTEKNLSYSSFFSGTLQVSDHKAISACALYRKWKEWIWDLTRENYTSRYGLGSVSLLTSASVSIPVFPSIFEQWTCIV